jgi:hypothetical protein
MKSAALLSAIFLAAATLCAQQQPAAPNSPPPDLKNSLDLKARNALDLEHTVSRCAIGMFARQGGGLHILRAGKDGQPAQPAMEPSLTLHGTNGKKIVSATITAHGYGAPAGATPLQTNNQSGTHEDLGGSLVAHPVNKTNPTNLHDQHPRLSRTLTVKFQHDGDADFSGDFRLPGFAVLETIDLNSITYADGSIQNFDASVCHVQPSPLMLVASGH